MDSLPVMTTRQPSRSGSIGCSLDEGVDCETPSESPTAMQRRLTPATLAAQKGKFEKKWDENYWFRGTRIAWHQREPSE